MAASAEALLHAKTVKVMKL